MIGARRRAAWISARSRTSSPRRTPARPTPAEVRDILLGHLEALHAFHGELSGVRIARKHLGWYAKDRAENAAFRAVVNRAETARAQLALTRDYFDALSAGVPPPLSAAA